MKKLLALAAFLLASTAAQAQMTFQYGGYTIQVDPDRGTVKIPGVYDNTGQKGKRAKTDQDSRKTQDPQAKVNPQPIDPQPAAAPATGAPAPATAAAPPSAAPAAPPTTANNAPAEAAVTSPPLPPPSAATPAQQNAAPTVTPPPLPPVPAPAVTAAPAAPLAAAAAAVPPAAPAPAPAPAPEQRAVAPTGAAVSAHSPLGLWLTEEKEGKVRIEQCGTNLCGYSVDTKTNQNGEQVLINMKPGRDKWTGRILDPNTGSTYDSTIALSGSDRLRVQGCAFGGMFCGGQTWTRVN